MSGQKRIVAEKHAETIREKASVLRLYRLLCSSRLIELYLSPWFCSCR